MTDKSPSSVEERLRVIEDKLAIYELIASHPPSADTAYAEYTASVCLWRIKRLKKSPKISRLPGAATSRVGESFFSTLIGCLLGSLKSETATAATRTARPASGGCRMKARAPKLINNHGVRQQRNAMNLPNNRKRHNPLHLGGQGLEGLRLLLEVFVPVIDAPDARDDVT
jgi:hypothetical protein